MKITLLFALLLGMTQFGFAAEPAPKRYAATIAPAEKFTSGVLAVEKHGTKGRPLILIPGLASGAWVWQGLIRELSTDYTLYVVTLPGFDGRPYAAGDGFAAARAGLRTLIASRKLDQPVLVGHSMGATLSFAVGEDSPQAIGGIVAIDGLPVFPGTEAMTPAERTAMVASMQAQPAKPDPAAFARQQQAYMRTAGVRDMAQADQLAQLSGRSDPAATGQYVSEVLALDLRPDLNRITVPILLLAPYFDQDPMDARSTPEGKARYFGSLLVGAPRVQVLPVPDARHFVMFDQPARVAAMVKTYLDSL